LWQIINHKEFRDQLPVVHPQVPPVSLKNVKEAPIFDILKKQDVLLHHPYNGIEPVVHLLEQAAEDPDVLAIKLTIYVIFVIYR